MTILRLGSVMLAFGALGLFIVRSTNDRLRGLGWLGGSFLCGFLGAGLLVLPLPPLMSVLGSDLFVVGGFALLHTAVMDLMTQRPRFAWSNVSLVSIVAVVDVLRLFGCLGPHFRTETISLLVAIQCSLTAHLLWKTARPAERVPAWFCCSLLLAFAGYNLMRVVLVATDEVRDPLWNAVATTGSYATYIAVALGLAFGFFWMSTAQLSIQLEHIAGTDPLTRLYNRRTFLKACEKELLTSVEKQQPFSVLMVDLDHFKSINDRYGHGVGDDALVAAVASMQNAIRGSDVLARWGGEEFAALLPNATLEAAMIVAERIRGNVERVRLPLTGEGPQMVLRMTVSVGATSCGPKDTIQQMMARADRALYTAKDGGRNRVVSLQKTLSLVPQSSTASLAG